MGTETDGRQKSVEEVQLPGRLNDGHQSVTRAVDDRAGDHDAPRAELIIELAHHDACRTRGQ